MLSTPSGTASSVREEQRSKALRRMLRRLKGSVMEVRLLHSLNAYSPIVVSVEGNEMDESWELLENERLPRVVTPSPITSFVMLDSRKMPLSVSGRLQFR